KPRRKNEPKKCGSLLTHSDLCNLYGSYASLKLETFVKFNEQYKWPVCSICGEHICPYASLDNATNGNGNENGNENGTKQVSDRDWVVLQACAHGLCRNCLNVYVHCFEFECNQYLDIHDVALVLSAHLNVDDNGGLNTLTEMQIFEKFTILCTLPPDERDVCPKCEMVFV
ncbi:hypothetical protein RFI_34890, partial [Reticulomyxa filosa]